MVVSRCLHVYGLTLGLAHMSFVAVDTPDQKRKTMAACNQGLEGVAAVPPTEPGYGSNNAALNLGEGLADVNDDADNEPIIPLQSLYIPSSPQL